MAQHLERVVGRIADAFKARELPQDDPVFFSPSFEVDMQTLESLARQSSWIDVPHDVVRDNPLAPAFMTAEAFAWFLPVYMIVSATQYYESETLTSTLMTCLTPPDPADAREFQALVDDIRALDPDLLLEEPQHVSFGGADKVLKQFTERATILNTDEKAAVRDYLEYIQAAHGEEFPVFGPKQALERYWAKVAQ